MKRYTKYKDTGFDWIGKIPDHWALATIGRINNLGRGRVISNVEIGENTGGYPVYSSQTENDGVMGCLDTYDFDGEYVTWTTDGANAGTVFYRKGKFNCTNVCGTMQPKNWDQIELRFIPYFLNLGTKYSVRLDINPKLMNNMMAKIPFVIPPKPEQTAIANYLDKKTEQIDNLITQKQKLIDLLKEERTAVINQAVTKGINHKVKLKPSGVEWLGEIPEHWGVKKLKYVASVNYSKRMQHNKELKDVVFLPMEKVSEEGYIYQEIRKYIHEVTSGFTYFERGDVIVAKITPCFENGKGAILNNLETPYGYGSTEFHTLKANDNILPVYLYYITKSERFMKIGEAFMTGSAGQKRVPASFIENFYIGLPAIETQKQIIKYIEDETYKIKNTILIIEREIELMQEYRTALISEVVTGKVKVA